MGQHHDPDDHHQDLDDDLGRPIYRGDGLTVRALDAEELQRFLDAHASQPARAPRQRLGCPRATRGTPPGVPGPLRRLNLEPPGRQAAVPGWAGRRQPGPPWPLRAGAQHRRRRAEELAAWAPSLAWRMPLVVAAGLTGSVLAGQAGLARKLATLAGLAVAGLAGWGLRFRPTQTPRLAARRGRGTTHRPMAGPPPADGYVVCMTWPSPARPANIDCDDLGRGGRGAV